jgi:prefoldin subunit 5
MTPPIDGISNMIAITLPVLVALGFQTPSSDSPPAEAVPASSPTASASVEELRERIHGMRMSLLFGGEKVKGAEGEAMDFYNQRIEAVNKSLDSIHTDLAEKNASYDAALRQALSGKDGAPAAMQRAQTLRAEIAALQRESTELSSTSTNLAKLVQTVQARQREREIMAARMDSSMSMDFGSFTLGSVGLAPDVQVRPDTSPFDDPNLVEDLFTRDPVAAARLLFAADPERYRRLFPLQPPPAALRQALVFPLPDLPGKR